ncbi:UNVERIFIED_CONTAM: hypothetical protein PYX00_002295 [Menopon gallinae]|uniref:Histone-lysine N-methyltransferase n=1 Tax=Menopon gallinae TaxID=328185 RepID=A0AAW2IGC2_9NEOP
MSLMEDPRLRQSPKIILSDCLADRRLIKKISDGDKGNFSLLRCESRKRLNSCSDEELFDSSLDGLLTPNPSSGDESSVSGSFTAKSLPKKRKRSDVVDGEMYEVERIEGYHRDKKGVNWYFVKWKNYHSNLNTYERIDKLLNCNRLLMEMLESGHESQKQEIDAMNADVERSMLKSSLYLKLSRCNFKREELMKFPRYETLNIDEIFGKKFQRAFKTIEADYQCIIRSLVALYNHRDPGLYARAVQYRIALDVCERRKRQLKLLQEQQDKINEREKCPVEVENNVDLDILSFDVEYTTEMKTGEGVYIPNDPFIGCNCVEGCGPNSKCCSQAMESVFAYNPNGRLRRLESTPIYECNWRCKCSAKCPNRVVQNGRFNSLAIFKTLNYGWGVKTLRDIKRGEFVCEYLGELISESESSVRDVIYNRQKLPYIFDLDFSTDGNAKYCIDATRCGNLARYINHSCDPNLVVRAVWIECLHPDMPRLAFFAKRHIRKNEELTFDYENKDEYKTAEESKERPVNYGMISRERCLCGSAKCREWLFGSS